MNTSQQQRGSFAFLGLIILATIFIFLAWWVRSPNFPLRQQNPEGTATEDKLIEAGVKYRIEITDKGFVPGVVTARPYDSVIFINRDSKPHWPVSGDLDNKRACEAFGQGRELAAGEGYAVVFHEEDECAFHDQLNEAFSAGTIFIQKK